MLNTIDRALKLALHRTPHGQLKDAMRYVLFPGGKRVRPILVLECAKAISPGAYRAAMPAAVAVEYVHTYSLVHDDLPAMDNDDFRRNKHSCHRHYTQATAILVGDALLSDAFMHLASSKQTAAKQCAVLANAIGSNGMVLGQSRDFALNNCANADELDDVRLLKTAKLFEASCTLGALSANASAEETCALASFGRNLGLAFQAIDDKLDSALDAKSCESKANAFTQNAIDEIATFGSRAKFLLAICERLLVRKH